MASANDGESDAEKTVVCSDCGERKGRNEFYKRQFKLTVKPRCKPCWDAHTSNERRKRRMLGREGGAEGTTTEAAPKTNSRNWRRRRNKRLRVAAVAAQPTEDNKSQKKMPPPSAQTSSVNKVDDFPDVVVAKTVQTQCKTCHATFMFGATMRSLWNPANVECSACRNKQASRKKKKKQNDDQEYRYDVSYGTSDSEPHLVLLISKVPISK